MEDIKITYKKDMSISDLVKEINKRNERLKKILDRIEGKIDLVNVSLLEIKGRLHKTEDYIAKVVDKNFNKVYGRLDEAEQSLLSTDERLTANEKTVEDGFSDANWKLDAILHHLKIDMDDVPIGGY